jgi:hypothetical protein
VLVDYPRSTQVSRHEALANTTTGSDDFLTSCSLDLQQLHIFMSDVGSLRQPKDMEVDSSVAKTPDDNFRHETTHLLPGSLSRPETVDSSAATTSDDNARPDTSHLWPDSLPRPDESTETLLAPQKSDPPHGKKSHAAPATLKKRLWFFEWRWELGSMLVSIVCVSLTATILGYMDGKPTRMWKLPIQPNSLVAVFSTIAKSALLVPIAEGMGQLKWDFFARPGRIVHMQTFDEASRGPWGATVLLWKIRLASLLAAFGSIITILLLAFEPFTQQVIDFNTRRAILANTSGFVMRTSTFIKEGFTNGSTEFYAKARFTEDWTEGVPRGLLALESKN